MISKVEWSDPANGLHLVLSAMDCPIWIAQLYTLARTNSQDSKMFPDTFFGDGNSFHTNPILGQEGMMFLEVFFHATMAQVSFRVACPWLSPRFRRNSQKFSERRVSKSKLCNYDDLVHFPPSLPSFLPLDIYFLPSGVLFYPQKAMDWIDEARSGWAKAGEHLEGEQRSQMGSWWFPAQKQGQRCDATKMIQNVGLNDLKDRAKHMYTYCRCI